MPATHGVADRSLAGLEASEEARMCVHVAVSAAASKVIESLEIRGLSAVLHNCTATKKAFSPPRSSQIKATHALAPKSFRAVCPCRTLDAAESGYR